MANRPRLHTWGFFPLHFLIYSLYHQCANPEPSKWTSLLSLRPPDTVPWGASFWNSQRGRPHSFILVSHQSFSYPGFLAFPHTWHSISHLQVFAQTLLHSWNVLPPHGCFLESLISFKDLLLCYLQQEAFPDPPSPSPNYLACTLYILIPPDRTEAPWGKKCFTFLLISLLCTSHIVDTS